MKHSTTTAYASAAAAVSIIVNHPLTKSPITTNGSPSSHFARHVAIASSFHENAWRSFATWRPTMIPYAAVSTTSSRPGNRLAM
jgi:hypothetical protein